MSPAKSSPPFADRSPFEPMRTVAELIENGFVAHAE